MDRNEKIRTYNYSRNSIADHRGDNKLTRNVANLKSYFGGDKMAFDVIEDLYRVLDNSNRKARLQHLLAEQTNKG